MLDPYETEEIGRLVASLVREEVVHAVQGVTLGYLGKVATQAVIGVAPIRNFIGPNGDAIQEAAIWMGVHEETAANYMWCPVARGVSVAGGDYIHVSRDSVGNRIWTVDRKS